MHPNLKQLSHSSRDTLHRCPKEYKIYKLSQIAERESSIDTVFGQTLGVGIQQFLLTGDRNESIWKMFLGWDGDLLSESDSAEAKKKRKFFWHTIAALDSFAPLLNSLLGKWEVAVFKGKPAVELSFRIDFGDGFFDRGHVDVVLRNKITGELMVVELKTTGNSNILEASYGNSQQGVGYGVVIDAVAAQYPEVNSSYTVLYLIYKTKLGEWESMPFKKTFLDRAEWIKSVMLDIAKLEMYQREDFWPKHGENCVRFFRECSYYGTCGISDKFLFGDESKIEVKLDNRGGKELVEYTFDLHVLDILEAQMEKQG